MSGDTRDDEAETKRSIEPEHVLAVRLGHGGNCSSVGSVVDTLFVGAAAFAALFAAVCAALREEPISIVGAPDDAARDPSDTDENAAERSAP